ncbi:MAG: hypothetical protein JST59_28895 [Actinobacteria bacterium]|nr:hypothetical protein [Actinomycetota bacterium]
MSGSSDEAYVSVADAESRLPAPVPEELFEFAAERALADLKVPHGRLWAVGPTLTPTSSTVWPTRRRPSRSSGRGARAWIHVYPPSIGEPDPLLAVDPGGGPAVPA